MKITVEQLRKIAKGKPTAANMQSVVVALNNYGKMAVLNQPHRLAHFIAQLAHESGGFQWDREIWGPTKAQKGYEGRADLGNTQKGDGSKFRGYGPIQVTGRGNTTRFHTWCIAKGLNPPDFTKTPALICTDPWEGLSAIWYWDLGNPEAKSLNRYADKNDIQMITRRINGGLNGYEDRLDYYDRAALVLLGLPISVREFQKANGLTVDGVSGPLTRAAMHKALVRLTHKDNAPAVDAGATADTSVVLVDGPKKDETTVVVVQTPKHDPAAPALPQKATVKKTGLMALVAIITAIGAAIVKYFGG